eukprot:scaffold97128_cov28-Tisochrysis_lutea.AAC.3
MSSASSPSTLKIWPSRHKLFLIAHCFRETHLRRPSLHSGGVSPAPTVTPTISCAPFRIGTNLRPCPMTLSRSTCMHIHFILKSLPPLCGAVLEFYTSQFGLTLAD